MGQGIEQILNLLTINDTQSFKNVLKSEDVARHVKHGEARLSARTRTLEPICSGPSRASGGSGALHLVQTVPSLRQRTPEGDLPAQWRRTGIWVRVAGEGLGACEFVGGEGLE
ncbi:hypothetical protein Vadar_010982 [Vaccinium darrowii]|uniref:Uncharacterized protein n=1 Tax=Vaccinium darrowii TaxID=229202 RepID=A0ACB7XZI2_9ERIC|nr:hypothetical protein Vadar_010982 [Vaccinium darrowii]